MCLCGEGLVSLCRWVSLSSAWRDLTRVWSGITVGVVVAASGENVGQVTSSGDNKIRLVPSVRPRMFPWNIMLRLTFKEDCTWSRDQNAVHFRSFCRYRGVREKMVRLGGQIQLLHWSCQLKELGDNINKLNTRVWLHKFIVGDLRFSDRANRHHQMPWNGQKSARKPHWKEGKRHTT